MNNKIFAAVIISSSLLCSFALISMDNQDVSMNISDQRYMSDDMADTSDDITMTVGNDEWNDDMMGDDDFDYENYDDYLNDYEDYNWDDEDWDKDFDYDEDDLDDNDDNEDDELAEQNFVVETEEMMPQGDVNELDDTRM